jgi:DtxR family Mn-dependent transcriptional regulator
LPKCVAPRDTVSKQEGLPVRSVAGDYLEAIYSLRAEGEDAYAVTLASMFGVSRAAASKTLERLIRDALVVADVRPLTLTDTGVERAEESLRRHRIAERFLTDVLGMGWAEAHDQARAFERGLTPFLEERIDDRLGRPRLCPHGNPIPRPGCSAATYYGDRDAFALTRAPVGTQVSLLAVSELAELHEEWVRQCEEWGLRPGVSLRVRERAGRHLAVEISGSEQAISIDVSLASHLWVVFPLENA